MGDPRQEMFMIGLTALQVAIDCDDPKRELLVRIKDLISEARALTAALPHLQAQEWREPQSSSEFQQQRGVGWDIVDEALITYREFMLDDDYDAMTALKKICDRMEDRRKLYQPQAALLIADYCQPEAKP